MSNVDNPQNAKNWARPVADSASLPMLIANSVRTAILTGVLRPEEKINEEALAGAFETSRTPVREALRLLEQEGLISVLSRRGAWVTPLLPEDAVDTYVCRAHLYGLAARLAAMRHQDGDVAKLHALMEELDGAVEVEDPQLYLQIMARINDTIISVSGNPHIRVALKPLDLKAVRYRHISVLLPDRLLQSRQNYARIISAIQNREPDSAEQAARTAIAEAGEALLAHLLPGGGLTIKGLL